MFKVGIKKIMNARATIVKKVYAISADEAIRKAKGKSKRDWSVRAVSPIKYKVTLLSPNPIKRRRKVNG